MATIKQIEANRTNATKSTGPRTTEGKDAVGLNALKHGLFAESTVVTGEIPADFDKLRDSWVLRWQPATPEEEALVTNLIRYTWLFDRFAKVERRIWNSKLYMKFGDHPVAYAHSLLHGEFDHLERRLNSAHRNFRCDLELLVKLQTARKKLGSEAPGADPAPESIPVPELIQPLTPAIGFVPANPQDAGSVPAFPDDSHPSILPAADSHHSSVRLISQRARC